MIYKKFLNRSKLRGRPRSELSRKAIIQATISLLEKKGYENLKIVDVARNAGVGKQTIYRWWRSKSELVIEAVLEETAKQIRIPDTGSISRDLRELIRASFHRLRNTSSGTILAGLLMAGRKDAATLKIFREQFIEARRDLIRGIFERYQDSQEIRRGINIELIMDLIYGAMWYRLLMEHAPLDDDFADELVDHILILILK
jgi:AcrR family transcriptional regulator